MSAYSIMHHLKVLSSENPTLNPPHFHMCVPNTREWFKTSTRQAAAVSKQNRVLTRPLVDGFAPFRCGTGTRLIPRHPAHSQATGSFPGTRLIPRHPASIKNWNQDGLKMWPCQTTQNGSCLVPSLTATPSQTSVNLV